MGIGLEDASALFSLSAYGNTDGAKIISENKTLRSYEYDGNPPKDETDQETRLLNIYDVGRRYFNSSYYQGTKNTTTDFGTYLMYLYISHYIDGPGRAPSSHELPYIISSNDILSYNIFINQQNMTTYVKNFTELASHAASGVSFATEVNKMREYGATVKEVGNIINDLAMQISGGTEISERVAKDTTKYVIANYTPGVNENDFLESVNNYVNNEIKNFYNLPKQEQETAKSMGKEVASLLVTLVLGQFSLGAALLFLIPNFVYSFVHYLKKTSLLVLNSTLSGRMADRVDIEIWG